VVRLRRIIYLSEMETYSVIEASEKLGISTRAVQKRCLKDNVRKKSNRYLITNEHIEKWFAEIKTNEPTNERSQDGTHELEKNINILETTLRTLEASYIELKGELKKAHAEIEKLDDTVVFKGFQVETSAKVIKNQKREIETLKDELSSKELAFDVVSQVNEDRGVEIEKLKALKPNQKIQKELNDLKQENETLKDQLSEYDIADNERIEVFTNEDYQIFEQRLREWYSLQKDIEHKDELFDAKEKSLTELLEHYKNQFEYQKNQSTKILDMHQKLIDTIQKQSTITIQRQIIEAKEKDIINDEWKTKD
jgi:hypothetical protein